MQLTHHAIDRQSTCGLNVLRSGGIVLAHADIGYGLLCHSKESVERMYQLKGRPKSNPCIVVGSLAILDQIGVGIEPAVRDVIVECSELTTFAVIVRAAPSSPLLKTLPRETFERASREETVAVFLRTGELTEALATNAASEGWLIVASSANRSGEGNSFSLDEVPHNIKEGVDLVLSRGECKYRNDERKATTILDTVNWRLSRRGVNAQVVEKVASSLRRLQP